MSGYSPDDRLEIIMEELEHYNPGFNEFYSLYLHGEHSGISLEVDCTPDRTYINGLNNEN